MSDPQLFIAFGAVMLVIALSGVVIDWFGKPFRHRKFVPKIYRYPEERRPRGSSVQSTEWSERAFVLPVAEAPPLPPMMAAGPPPAVAAVGGERHGGEAVHRGDSVFDQDLDDPGPPTAVVAPVRPDWQPGDSVFAPGTDGGAPRASTVRERYWRNVAGTAGAKMFGADNVDRMIAGRGPRRRNPRTGSIETMRLPGASGGGGGAAAPMPEWPDDAVDPFAGP